MKAPRTSSSTRGFTRTSTLLQKRIRAASEGRGFSETRLLTRWAEIAGTETAAVCRPVEVSYSRGGLGATLTLLTTGAHAPMLEMQLPALIEKVNACYGYAAIRRIRLTQTAPTGFAEGQAAFAPAPKAEAASPNPAAVDRARQQAGGVTDGPLRDALTRLGANVFSRQRGSEQ